MYTVYKVISGTLILLSTATLCLFTALYGWMYFYVSTDDTAYSSGFSESAFQTIQVGMKVQQVHARLGLPIDRWELGKRDSGEFGERWSYSPNSKNYHVRTVLYNRDRVTRKIAEFYWD